MENVRLQVFAVVVLLPSGQRKFQVNAPSDASAREAVGIVLGSEGLSGPFDMVVRSQAGGLRIPVRVS